MSFDVERPKKQPAALYRNVKCDGCGEPLRNVGPSVEGSDAWPCLQPDDALILELVGGYGMAIDPFGDATDSDLAKIICGKCLPKLCEQWPCFMETIQKHCSSSLGHHCSKERKFVWRTYSDCCNSVCEKCGQHIGSFTGKRQDSTDEYSRPIGICYRCNHEGPCPRAWEGTVP